MSAKPRLGRLALVVLAVCTVAIHQHAWGFSTNRWERLLVSYGFDTWAGQTKVPYECPVTNWVPDFASLGVSNFLARIEGVQYIFYPPDAPAVTVYIRMSVCQDASNACVAMLQDFYLNSCVQPFPLGPPLGVDVGDRCYLSWCPPDVGSAVSFVRNNVFISVMTPTEYSVTNLAQRLDSDLVVHSFTGPVLMQPALSEGAFNVSVPTVSGKTYTLEGQNSLTETNWTALPSFIGDGTIMPVTLPAGPEPQQFFRLRVQ